MVKNISDKQKSFKFLKAFSICLNIIGVICLIYFMIPYVTHDMSIKNPNAMLAGYSWDSCGFVLCLGLIPLVIANTLLFVSFQGKKILKALFYIPSVICLITVCHYLFIATDWKEEEPTSEHVVSMKCVTKDSKLFKYSIYKEQNGEYTLGMDEYDKFPLNIVDYSSPDEMINSIESYYKSNGGSCT